ncbi:MAG: C39 family peptidase [Coleofasciculaceae cyanobacterium SM2_1_6]|nr:C39 family peptidase [Coleofasciculaceae cyanobacterium SM2_1_6]
MTMPHKYLLKITQSATLKIKPVDPQELADHEKFVLPFPKTCSLHSFVFDRATNHLKVAFLFDSFNGRNTWYLEAEGVELFDRDTPLNFQQLPPEKPATHDLPIPYFSQLDNLYNPTGSCNVTSIAMSLYYLGLRSQDPDTQLEDELYRYCLDHQLSRHDPLDLAQVVRDYGYADDFQAEAKWAEVKTWLLQGNPIVVHGYFTNFGHIIVIRGFNQQGWIVNDPYGLWTESGYDTNASGEGLLYSYAMMKQICGDDGDLWIHYISKK